MKNETQQPLKWKWACPNVKSGKFHSAKMGKSVIIAFQIVAIAFGLALVCRSLKNIQPSTKYSRLEAQSRLAANEGKSIETTSMCFTKKQVNYKNLIKGLSV